MDGANTIYEAETDSKSFLTDYDIYLFKAGRHFKLYEKLGAHVIALNGISGVYFAVWAPNAIAVSLIGDFNYWDGTTTSLKARADDSGIWEGFFTNVKHGDRYKYSIETEGGVIVDKTDPFARYAEGPPGNASLVWSTVYNWKDGSWLEQRKSKVGKAQPYSVYEVHLGSWRRKQNEARDFFSYTILADELVKYVTEMAFTHVEFMPIMEHPFFGSWGYQITGYFAPTSRYGSPNECMYLIDRFHQAGIGVIIDWVPSHFPGDAHGLFNFDGTHLFEHADVRQGFHPDWNSYIYNYGRKEIKSFLISSAVFWLEHFHADGIRVDAVASMLYLDYSRRPGEWIANKYGGVENLEAIAFLRELNEVLYDMFPDTVVIAEESTAWPAVTVPTYLGGLGFGQKWMMGWMHDALNYFSCSAALRRLRHVDIARSISYAFTENFMLPLSHDEVVHGKGSLLAKMPGDEWQKFANLRCLYTYMFVHPGTKLLFMGCEFAQSTEWNHDKQLDWDQLENPYHRGIQALVRHLNIFYVQEKALYQLDFRRRTFQWVDASDQTNSVIVFVRKSDDVMQTLLVVCNFSQWTHEDYRIGVVHGGMWEEVLNSDDCLYGGSGVVNTGIFRSYAMPFHGLENSITITLPPLGVTVFKYRGSDV